ncbi:MAG: protein kinase [Candidatus Wallbacteria bacterium]|nr:protein kinase [Candidatus Wallbacteria bacterium]
MGERFGPYEILERLGAGGMSVVFRAYWESKQIDVALKRLHPESSLEAIRRFQREIKIVSALSHPHIVGLLDHGQVGGVHYYTMQIVDGETLSARIDRCQKNGVAVMSVDEFHSLADGLLSALEYLHEQKVYHRDLKPSNLFVAKDGRALLADFGLSRLTEATKLTGSGDVIGTPGYLAPEQMRGGVSTAETDVYQCGLVFYEMLTGKLPFAELGELGAISLARVSKPIPAPSRLNPSVPSPLDRVVVRCLEVEAARRYVDAGELRRALAAAKQGILERPIAPPKAIATVRRPVEAPPSKGPRAAWIAAATGVLSLAGAVLLIAPGSRWRGATASSAPPGADEPAAGKLHVSVEPGRQEALVSFRTAERARATLELDGPEGHRNVTVSAAAATNHSTWLTELAPATRYSFRVRLERAGLPALATPAEQFETLR